MPLQFGAAARVDYKTTRALARRVWERKRQTMEGNAEPAEGVALAAAEPAERVALAAAEPADTCSPCTTPGRCTTADSCRRTPASDRPPAPLAPPHPPWCVCGHPGCPAP